MNAQEAIELVQGIKSDFKSYPEGILLDERKEFEVLSIVLESAKLFHKSFKEGNLSKMSSEGRVIIIGSTMDIDLTKSEAEEVGIYDKDIDWSYKSDDDNEVES